VFPGDVEDFPVAFASSPWTFESSFKHLLEFEYSFFLQSFHFSSTSCQSPINQPAGGIGTPVSISTSRFHAKRKTDLFYSLALRTTLSSACRLGASEASDYSFIQHYPFFLYPQWTSALGIARRLSLLLLLSSRSCSSRVASRDFAAISLLDDQPPRRIGEYLQAVAHGVSLPPSTWR
jgi:hypothetical protein